MIDRALLERSGLPGQPLSERLRTLLLTSIREGRLAPTERLPSIRSMATACALSPDTVVRVYDRLVEEGALRAVRGSGFYVAAPRELADDAVRHRPFVSQMALPLTDWRILLRTDVRLDRRPGTGIIDWSGADGDDVARAVRAAARATGGLPSDHADLRGYLPLRLEIQRKLAGEGINCTPDQIFTGAGATGAMNLLVRALVRPGDAVLMEEPGPFIHQALLMSQGAQPYRIPREPTGPDLAALRRACELFGPRLFFLSSLLQNPTGTSIAPHRAHELLRLADEFNLTLVDDASMADLWPADQAAMGAPLALLDRRGIVLHIGSFSASFSPAGRVGFLVATKRHAEWLETFRPLQGLGNAVLHERVVYQHLAAGLHRRRSVRLTKYLADRRATLTELLRGMGFDAAQGAGPYVWQPLGAGVDAKRIATALLELGFLAAPGIHFGFSHAIQQYMRLNVTTTSKEVVCLLRKLVLSDSAQLSATQAA